MSTEVGVDAADLLKRNGYVVIKKPLGVSTTDLSRVRKDVLMHASSVASSFKYKVWRFFNRVHTSKQRHSIPIPIFDEGFNSSVLPTILESYVKQISPVLSTIFEGRDAKLVELAALVSYPGATSQKIHSDMQYTDKTTIISCFIALKDVTVKDGPTSLFPRSHTRSFHEKNVAAFGMKKVTFSADGERETNEDIHRYHIDKDSNTPFDGGMDDFEATQIARGDQAQQALLCAGDVLLFNTTIFHFGEANRSNDPRVLLGFAFQSNNDDGDACFELDKTNGFTYHITPDVERAALKLLNFHLVKTPYSSGVHVR